MRNFTQILILLILFSCSQKKEQKEKNIEKKSVIEIVESTVLEIDTFKIDNYSPLLKEWLNYYKANSIKLTDFVFINQDSLRNLFAHVDTFELSNDIYEPYYKYSPNGLIALDLTSYNYSFEKNENNEIVDIGGEPDSEVSIKDLKNKIWKRLLFVGPDCIVEDGFWINDDQLIIVGQYDENGQGNYNPIIWFMDLDKNIEQYFENKNIINSNCDYLENIKYKSIKPIKSKNTNHNKV